MNHIKNTGYLYYKKYIQTKYGTVRGFLVIVPCFTGERCCEYGPHVLFVHQGNVCLGLAECCVGESSENIEAGFSLSFSVICVCFDRNAPVAYHYDCGGHVGVRYKCVVECYCGLGVA